MQRHAMGIGSDAGVPLRLTAARTVPEPGGSGTSVVINCRLPVLVIFKDCEKRVPVLPPVALFQAWAPAASDLEGKQGKLQYWPLLS